jgi:putative Holliday junction resolvase
MRLLCLDPGSRHIGAAVSSGAGSGVVEFGSYANNRGLWPTLSKICHDEAIDRIVIGHARNLDGTLTEQSKASEEFAERVRSETGKDVVFEDESATSSEARDRLKALGLGPEDIEERIHSMSAAVILEGYLASHPA